MSSENKRSLPHTSKDNPEQHIDHEVDIEGGTMKAHEPVEGGDAEKVPPKSPEGLRQRLGSQKGN